MLPIMLKNKDGVAYASAWFSEDGGSSLKHCWKLGAPLIFIVGIVWMQISRKLLQSLDCVYDSNKAPYMRGLPTITCWKDGHIRYILISIFASCIYFPTALHTLPYIKF